MTKRNTQQRRHSIVQQVNAHGEVSVDGLAQQFITSEVTIRKDLAFLENSGLLLRRYGGAVAMPKELVDDPTHQQTSDPLKTAIAAKAVELIRDHNRIIVDSGRTTLSLIPHLTNKKGLVVMTNALQVAHQIQALENEPTLLMTGGTWDPHSESFQGLQAEQVLRAYDFDQLFIGADGLDLERGTTTFNELIGLSRVMAEVSREVIVLAESQKLARKIPNLELSWSLVDVLVTDHDISMDAQQQLKAQHVRVVKASPSQNSSES